MVAGMTNEEAAPATNATARDIGFMTGTYTP
jgi:hypothetical protein